MLLRVLLIDSDPASRRQVRDQMETLAEVVVVEEASDPAAGLRKGGAGADIALVEVPAGDGEARALEGIAQLLRRSPGIAVMATGAAASPELVLRAIRAGAVEFLPRPIAREDLAAALAKLRRIRQAPSSAGDPVGRLTAVYATKGGLGVTTLATNLAVCLAQRLAGEVILLDLDLRHGGVTTLLNLRPSYSVLDAFGQSDRLDEPLLRGLLAHHPSGLRVLAAPTEIEQSHLPFPLPPVQMREALEVIRSHFAHVVLDLPHDVDPGTVIALEEADEIIYLVGLDVLALRAAAAGLAAFRHGGIDQRKVKLVAQGGPGDLARLRQALGAPIFWSIPYDYPTVSASINEGTPLVLGAPRTEIARNLWQLTETLLVGRAVRQEGTDGALSLVRRLSSFSSMQGPWSAFLKAMRQGGSD